MKPILILLCSLLTGTALADGLRDPTRPPLAVSHSATVRAPAPLLSAVLSVDGARSAIFNGHLVHVGAVVDGYSIEEVFADGVRIRRAGVAQELRLPQPMQVIKKPAADGEQLAGGAK